MNRGGCVFHVFDRCCRNARNDGVSCTGSASASLISVAAARAASDSTFATDRLGSQVPGDNAIVATKGRTMLPVIDLAGEERIVAAAIGAACRDAGFFYVVGHDVDPALGNRLEHLSRAFFALDLQTKMRIRMELGGRAWRGYFPLGGELTSGIPDDKEGLYFGAELDGSHPRVVAGTPLHGRNLFPQEPDLRDTVLGWLDAMARLAQRLMRGVALSLGLDPNYFFDRYTFDPLILFRIFNYPGVPARPPSQDRWGVGEHTDYGVLTILKQDDVGGLQVKSKSGWVDAPPLGGAFVCNIGDMLDRMTRGLYRSTPHRVRNRTSRDRLSFPFFFDPGFDTVVMPIETLAIDQFIDDREQRWDQTSVHTFAGTYGDYVLGKVFPALTRGALPSPLLHSQ
jgi:isopenicillin N synthase-like dioxygenase